jgi:PEP-CTERM motif
LMDNDDIAGFVQRLLGGSPASAVPEPSSVVLLGLGVAWCAFAGRTKFGRRVAS